MFAQVYLEAFKIKSICHYLGIWVILRFVCSEMPKVVTQAERRGELLRAQADAVMSVKFESGQAQDVSFYTGTWWI